MTEWSSYTLVDLLPYDRATAYRLYELAHAGLWPAQWTAVPAAFAFAVCLWRGTRTSTRVALAILAAAWGMVAAGYLARYLADLLWISPTLAWMAGAYAVALALLAWRPGRLAPSASPCVRRLALAVAVWALVLHPVLGPWLTERQWTGIDLFAITPAPTAVATLALALAVRGWAAAWLWPGPLAWAALAGAAAWVLVLPVVAATLAVGAAAVVARLACALIGPREPPAL